MGSNQTEKCDYDPKFATRFRKWFLCAWQHIENTVVFYIQISDGSVVSFQKTAVAVLASVVVFLIFLITAVAVLMQLC